MFTFLLSALSLYLSIKAIRRGIEISKSKSEIEYVTPSEESSLKLTTSEAKFYNFLTSDDADAIFRETEQLFNDAIKEATENESFGYLGHETTMSKTVYNFKIQLSISPNEIKWEVFDLSQSENLRSYHMYALVYSRSRKIFTYDEVRINEGDKYSHEALMDFEKYNILPFNFRNKFNLLNDCGWNKSKMHQQTVATQQINETETEFGINRINKLLLENEVNMDKEVFELFNSILHLTENILKDELVNRVFTEDTDIEFKHDLNRLLEHELLKILEIYLALDENSKADVKKMTVKSLEKAHNELAKKYVSFQQERKSALKQIHLVMEERYD